MDYDETLRGLRALKEGLLKQAFQPVPAPGGGPAPMAPGMQPGMDPAAQGMPPGMQPGMDPAMAQGGMMDPAMGGQMPPDAAAVGAPQEDPMPAIVSFLEDVTLALQTQQQDLDSLKTEMAHQKEMRAQREALTAELMPPA